MSKLTDIINQQREEIERLNERIDELERINKEWQQVVQPAFDYVDKHGIAKPGEWKIKALIKHNNEMMARGIEKALYEWENCSDKNLIVNLKFYANQLRGEIIKDLS